MSRITRKKNNEVIKEAFTVLAKMLSSRKKERPRIILPQHSFDMSSTAPVEEPLMLPVPSAEEQEKQRAYKEQQIKFTKLRLKRPDKPI